ncbi:WW domain-containing adapter protein with coiled-coil isoform X2 [Hyalella azteca]|uniref:WW domain-containing adapter protein with coiled-coil isoform X2 n=1 Tax=Hyalella azteca TaxID=294128 RepID=A0A8B7PLK0_HYAAZ|nr:WW domain-containing adapter protein with coiled-coil isoform X2 [Hyalella azteca]
MVMHARKLPRISDGFTEKHQSHSTYESAKYTSSSSAGGGGGGGGGSGGTKYRGGGVGAYPDKRIDSPSTNSLRSSSPDSRSQSPRYHKSISGSANYYKREAYRDREFNSRDYRENREGSRSPKERRRDGRERDAAHVSRSTALKKENSSSSSQQYRVGDWSEHVSSSGKRYYYNCRTEVSQWEKPADWQDWEQQQQHGTRHPPSVATKNSSQQHYNNQHNSSSKGAPYNSSSSLLTASSSSNSSKVPYNNLASHPNSKPSSSSNYSSHSASTNNSVSSSSYNANLCKGSSSSSVIMNNSSSLTPTNIQHSLSLAPSTSSSSHHHHNQHHHPHLHHHGNNNSSSGGNNTGNKDINSQQNLRGNIGHDKNKHSNVDNSREHLYRGQDELHDKRPDPRKYQAAGQDMDISSGGSTPTSESVLGRSKLLHQNSVLNTNVSTPSPLLLPATCLPSNHHPHHHPHHHPQHHSTTSSNHPRLGPYSNAGGTNTSTTNSNINITDLRHHQFANSSNTVNVSCHNSINNSSDTTYINNVGGNNNNKGHGDLLTINTSTSGLGGQGPPTPTHSETHDNSDPRKDGSGSNGLGIRVPTSVLGGSSGSNTASVGVSLSSLNQPGTSGSPWTSSLSSSLSSQRPSHPPPALTPSLTNYYNESLISHVRDWPAENIEKQSQRLSEEAHTMGSLLMTKVSADLKMARSLVRLAEIQATLHEQRLLFLRAQKRELEDMGLKSQNSFLSDGAGGNS